MKLKTLWSLGVIVILCSISMEMSAQSGCIDEIAIYNPTVSNGEVQFFGSGVNATSVSGNRPNYWGEYRKKHNNTWQGPWTQLQKAKLTIACTGWLDILVYPKDSILPGDTIFFRVIMRYPNPVLKFMSNTVCYPKKAQLREAGDGGIINAGTFTENCWNGIEPIDLSQIGLEKTLGEMMPDEETSLVVYPNPVKDFATIANPSGEANTIEIFNIAGQKVTQLEIPEGDKQFTLRRENIAAGLYIFRDKYGATNKIVFR